MCSVNDLIFLSFKQTEKFTHTIVLEKIITVFMMNTIQPLVLRRDLNILDR